MRPPSFRLSACVLTSIVLATAHAGPTSAQVHEADTPVLHVPDDPLLQSFRWRSIGPAGQGGRVDDIAVHPNDRRTWLVGFATGGLWKTTNMGTTFEPVFDSEGTHSIGDIAYAPSNPDIVYVGTGEANNRQSSSFGDGIYRSEDGGETFTHVGLRETQTIARVRVHPQDADIVWVAANGHLFGPNAERGVYKSTNGGASWRKVLFVDDNTGATDLVVNPANPDIVFAATYQRRRTACCFVGGGPGSGLWRSTDGGETWQRLEAAGLPDGTLGRIALAVTPANPDVVYAQIEVAPDNATPLTDEEREEWQQLAEADSLPPDPYRSGVWRSLDGGATWEFRGNENGRPMYFSQIRVSPVDADLVYVVDQRVHKSRDGGRTFERLDGYGHVDQHAFWIDPANHDHLLIGNDGGVDESWDQGATWASFRSWSVGQPYHASVDMRRPFHVCTGLQDNGSWCGPSHVRSGPILAEDWYRVGGGDGFYTAVDPDDPGIVFVESQNGNLRRVNLHTGETTRIRPTPPDDDDPATNIVPAPSVDLEIRWNWNTPLVLSPNNPRTVYAGGNRLFVSRDRGETWTMTRDLTKAADTDTMRVMGLSMDLPRCRPLDRGQPCILSRNDGVSNWSTITTIAESPVQPDVLWVGTDDGNVQLSRDGGTTWTEVSANLPGGTTLYYVSRVEASPHDAATAFVSIDGHKSDDLRPYVYVTRDWGQTWTDIAADLPPFGNVNTIRQDPRNADLLYVGTEFGFFISLDGGEGWQRFMPDLPVVRIDDVLVHPRDNDLVLATHGRSVWVMDDVTPLQAVTDSVLALDIHLFTPREAVLWKSNIRKSRAVTGNQVWTGETAPPGTAIHYHLGSASDNGVSIRIVDPITDEVVRDLDGSGDAGLHRVRWDLRANPVEPDDEQGPFVEPGVYRVVLEVDGEERSGLVDVLEDIWMPPIT